MKTSHEKLQSVGRSVGRSTSRTLPPSAMKASSVSASLVSRKLDRWICTARQNSFRSNSLLPSSSICGACGGSKTGARGTSRGARQQARLACSSQGAFAHTTRWRMQYGSSAASRLLPPRLPHLRHQLVQVLVGELLVRDRHQRGAHLFDSKGTRTCDMCGAGVRQDILGGKQQRWAGVPR